MPTNPFDAVQGQALANMRMVAEAEVRLAAAGQVSLGTWQKQAAALDFLNGRQRERTKEEEKLSKNAKVLQGAFKGIQSSMLTAAATVTGTFMELRHLAGAANPGYLRAFDGALGILQARLGGALIPAFDVVIDTVMDAADWFEGLSAGSKKLVAGGMVAIPAVVGLGSALRALSPVLTLAALATKKLSAAAREHSTIAAFATAGGTAAGAAGAAYAVYQLAQAHSDKYNDAVRQQEAAEGKVTDAEIREARRISRKLGRGDKVTDEQFEKMSEQERRQYFQQRAAFLRPLSERLRGHWWATEGEAKEPLSAAMTFERAAKEGASVPGEESARKKIQRQSMRVSAMQHEQQPRYSALAEARKNTQLQILGKDRYQQEILREQRKHRQEEIHRLDELIREFRRRFPNANLMG